MDIPTPAAQTLRVSSDSDPLQPYQQERLVAKRRRKFRADKMAPASALLSQVVSFRNESGV